jgi:hypothetical protein
MKNLRRQENSPSLLRAVGRKKSLTLEIWTLMQIRG